MKNTFTLISILFTLLVFCQKSNTELEKEISSLKDSTEIRSYWNQIHQDDQSVRGKVTVEAEKMDRQNIKRVLLMFKYHGYPNGFCYGCKNKSIQQNNFTPNIVITHNRVTEVSEIMFPFLQKAYEEGKANEFWYIHNLRGMVRKRYGRDFYEKTKENIPLFIEKLNPYLKKDISYDLDEIDILFNEYDKKLNSILTSKLIFTKKKKGIRNNIYQIENGKLFWQKSYSDNSFNFPQEIYFDKEKNVLKYVLLDEEIKNEILIKNIEIFK
jgi:hypothetical protein